MDFERAADLHTRWEKVKAIAALADDLVRPIPDLRALIIQRAVSTDHAAEHSELAAIFLLRAGQFLGPEPLSTLGVRAVREQTSVGSSLFAQPLMLQAIPLDSQAPTATESPETRAEAVLAQLESAPTNADSAILSDHLSLFRRWYYRPEKQRQGEVLLPNPDGSFPARKLLRAAARTVLGDPKSMQPTDREGAKAIKTKILHAGRPDVERIVPDLAAISSSSTEAAPQPRTFRSRRSSREPRP